MPPFRKRFSTDPTLPLRGRVKGFSMESISPVILRVREARAPAAGFSAPEPFGGFVRCASLIAPCPMRGARKTAPRIHTTETGAGTTVNRCRSWPPHSRTPQARAPPRFRARRENLRRIGSAAVLPPRRAAKENPARLQACGVYRWGGVGCWPLIASLCDNRRVPRRRLTCWAGPST